MDKSLFYSFVTDNTETINVIRNAAWKLHESVNQTYDGSLPYGYHLSMVADFVMKYGYEVIADVDDILPLIFGAFFHDSIEDARITYNDLSRFALKFFDSRQANIAVEIVYALNNDKGRTREERAGDKYYNGIRQTPYAPFVKLCDRFANISYSCSANSENGRRMKYVYQNEWNHFIEAISTHIEENDIRMKLSPEIINEIETIFNDI